MADLEKQFDEWRKTNPLRMWRNEHGISMVTVAAATGASVNMVVKWENGSNTPGDDRMARLARITKKKNLKTEWETWLAAALAIK